MIRVLSGCIGKTRIVQTMAFAISVALVFTLSPAEANQQTGQELVVQSVVDDGGKKILQQSAVISAPLEDVWSAFITEEGYSSWAAPHAKIDFRVGGVIETSYTPDFTVGAPENIKNEILAYLPQRLLVLKNTQAPANFAPRELLDRLVSIFEFEAVSENTTKVTIHGIGYGTDEASLRLIAFFEQGNAWTFEQLEKKFTKETE